MKMNNKLLTEEEMDRLDDFLLIRNRDEDDELEYDESLDEGVLCISELDGFFAAIVSGPVLIPPSGWLPKIWGDFEPEWNSEDEFMGIFSLMTKYMNGIVTNLMSGGLFQPLFMENTSEEKNKTYLIVDEWCEGYMRGVTMVTDAWDVDGLKMKILLAPIRAFTMDSGWAGLGEMSNTEVENIQKAIAPNVDEIHAYWLKHREHDTPATAQTYRKDSLAIGRNDPCSCGSGKKYKKCCLH